MTQFLVCPYMVHCAAIEITCLVSFRSQDDCGSVDIWAPASGWMLMGPETSSVASLFCCKVQDGLSCKTLNLWISSVACLLSRWNRPWNRPCKHYLLGWLRIRAFNVGSWLVQQPFDFGAECVGPCCYMFSGQVRLSGFQHAQVYHLQGFFVKNSFTISFRRLSFWPLSMPVSLIWNI